MYPFNMAAAEQIGRNIKCFPDEMWDGIGYSIGDPNLLRTQIIDVPGLPTLWSKFGKSEKSTGFDLLVFHWPS